MLDFLLTVEHITGKPTDKLLMDYALRKESERIHRDTKVSLSNTPINVGKIKWRRWGKLNA